MENVGLIVLLKTGDLRSIWGTLYIYVRGQRTSIGGSVKICIEKGGEGINYKYASPKKSKFLYKMKIILKRRNISRTKKSNKFDP